MRIDPEVLRLRRFRATLYDAVGGRGVTPLMALQALHAYVDTLDGKAGRKRLAAPVVVVVPLADPAYHPHHPPAPRPAAYMGKGVWWNFGVGRGAATR